MQKKDEDLSWQVDREPNMAPSPGRKTHLALNVASFSSANNLKTHEAGCLLHVFLNLLELWSKSCRFNMYLHVYIKLYTLHLCLPSPQTRLCALLRLTAYQPVSCNAARVAGSIRTVVESPSTAAMMEPCRTRDSQWEDTLPWGTSCRQKVLNMSGEHMTNLEKGSAGAAQYQVLQRPS